ncbi:unnamed protein product [Allacma fusca]|uniref:Uncharacterized protein n=1 Tax=Allacma fusca TaxID=39272 RepID=A0A8J2PP26_9HEXA|nr:unnamed protein product [Allacma fusca]
MPKVVSCVSLAFIEMKNCKIDIPGRYFRSTQVALEYYAKQKRDTGEITREYRGMWCMYMKGNLEGKTRCDMEKFCHASTIYSWRICPVPAFIRGWRRPFGVHIQL